jgi:hypothetical protein
MDLMQEEPALSLCPLLIIHGDPDDTATLLHYLPVSIATEASRLTRLAAAPLSLFRFVGPQAKSGFTYPLDVWFTAGPLGFTPRRDLLRPVVVWSSRDDIEVLLAKWLQEPVIFVEFVSERRSLVERLAKRFDGVSNFVAVDVSSDELPICADAPARIWRGFTRMLEVVTGNVELGVGIDSTRIHISDWKALADEGCVAPIGRHWLPKPVPDDFVVAPPRILRNFLAFQINDFPRLVSAGNEAYAIAAADAAEAFAFRGLANAFLLARREGISIERFRDFMHEHDIDHAWADWIYTAREGGAMKPPAAEPPMSFRKLAPPQVVLVCAATSAETRTSVAEADWKIGGGVALRGTEDHAYFEILVDAIIAGGRIVKAPAPANEREQAIFDSVGGSVRRETFSAIAILHASRFGAPVVKLPTMGANVMSEFRAVNTILESSSSESDLSLTAADSLNLVAAVSRLSSVLTEDIPEPTRNFLASLETEHGGQPPPLVHAFSDVPLELLRIGDDYLGYRADVSRTPLTPGILPFANYQQTELTTVLPTGVEEFLIVTPFENDPGLNGIFQTRPSHVPDYQHRFVRRRDDVFDALNDEAVRCLVYFGHGLWDEETHSSALVLRDNFFTTQDVERLDRIPPVVILIGCNTAAAGSLLGGLHAALFARGAQLIVGTSFPVPRVIGALFLTLTISNILSPGVSLASGAWQPYRDLGEIMGVVRRRLRCQSDLYALHAAGRLRAEDLTRGMERFIELMEKTPQTSPDDRYQFQLERRLLVELGVLPNEMGSLAGCGAVPYPLFFQTLGFPWTTRGQSWIT